MLLNRPVRLLAYFAALGMAGLCTVQIVELIRGPRAIGDFVQAFVWAVGCIALLGLGMTRSKPRSID